MASTGSNDLDAATAAGAPVPGCDSLIFVQPTLDENLRCTICLEACMEATTACNEGHTFCGPCLRQMRAGGDEKCPTCRAERIDLPNRPLRQMIDALQVRCCEGDDGEGAPKRSRTEGEESRINGRGVCAWEGTLGQWKEEHKKLCPYVSVRCPFLCSKVVRRKDLEEHKGECPLRKVECGACSTMVEHNSLDYHRTEKCPKAHVKCRFCGEEMTREALNPLGEKRYLPPYEQHPGVDEDKGAYAPLKPYTGHLAECPKAILCCEFRSRGCDATFTREDAAKHHAEKAQHHAALVNQTLARLYNWLDWDYVEILWPINRERLEGSENLVLKSSPVDSLSCYELYLKLHLKGPDDPIQVGICSTSMSCYPTYAQVRLKNINVRATDTYINHPKVFAETEIEEEKRIDPPRNRPGVFEFKTTLKNSDGDAYTRAAWVGAFDYEEERCAIRAHFRIRKQSSAIVRTIEST